MSVFKGKVVFITGGTVGIGRGIAEELARRGSRVVITGRDRARTEKAAEAIRAAGGDCHAAAFDVADHAAFARSVEEALRISGRIDYLFNNAGTAVFCEGRDQTVADWRRVLDVDVMGVVHGIDLCYPIMIKQGAGHIINISSLAGLLPVSGSLAYVAAKHALVGMTGVLRMEGAPLGVRFSVACPGAIATGWQENVEWRHIDYASLMKTLPDKPQPVSDYVDFLLRGVERNEAMIISGFARFMWRVHRLSPWITERLGRWMAGKVAANRAETLKKNSSGSAAA